MRNTLSRWIERKLAEGTTSTGTSASSVATWTRTHAPLSTGEVVCWHCAEQAGEFEVPRQMEWRVSDPI